MKLPRPSIVELAERLIAFDDQKHEVSDLSRRKDNDTPDDQRECKECMRCS